MLNMNEVKLLTDDPDNKRRHRFQVITIAVSEAGQRIDIDTIASITNERIVGITLFTPTPEGQRALAQSTLSLNIDNQEILPKDFDCSLIMHKADHSFYESILQINEPAEGKQITGTFTNTSSEEVISEDDSGNVTTLGDIKYDVKLYLWSIAK